MSRASDWAAAMTQALARIEAAQAALKAAVLPDALQFKVNGVTVAFVGNDGQLVIGQLIGSTRTPPTPLTAAEALAFAVWIRDTFGEAR